jgi:hypothetical protein
LYTDPNAEDLISENYKFLKTINLTEDSGSQHNIDVGDIEIIELEKEKK